MSRPGAAPQRSAWRAIGKLTLLFAAWKAILVAVVLLTPDVGGRSGYDTSGDLWWAAESANPEDARTLLRLWRRLLVRLTRWDAVYFAATARRGYAMEQEWAFGWGWTRAMSWAARRGTELTSLG
jgi:phosphatidylinositol glycan class V